MNSDFDTLHLQIANKIAHTNIELGGGPFGAIIVENNKIIASSGNNVTILNDPTAHAEIEAIRIACKQKKSYSLENCTIYCSCEPCPMCLGAIYWANINKIVFASNRNDAASAGFNDNFIYNEMQKPINERNITTIQINIPESNMVFEKWLRTNNIKKY